jgi:predicted TIM-barrel fold metal-dependent hydrolase
VGATPTSAEHAKDKGVAIASQELTDVSSRLADLDRLGFERQVLYPTLWLGCVAEDTELEAALARSYNDFMAEQCALSHGRLWYAAVIPFRRPKAAVEEIRRIRKRGSVASIFVRALEWDLPINDASFHPIYEEAAYQNLAIAVHLGFGSPALNRIFETVTRGPGELHFIAPQARSLVSRHVVQFAFNRLVEGRLLEDFPSLRWVFLETGSEWIIAEWKAIQRLAGVDCRRYLRGGRIFVSCEPDEDLAYLASQFGEECFVMGSDMPHADTSRHDSIEASLRRRTDLSERFMEKILWHNPARLYGFEPPNKR